MNQAVKLIGNLYVVGGANLTHPWDANAFLLAGDEPTLIDCGSVFGYSGLKQGLAELGYAPRDVVRVLATHGHWDHLSAMAKLRAEGEARLYAHAADRPAIESGDWDRTSAFLYGVAFPPVQVDRCLEDGDSFKIGGADLRVYHTPGHSPGGVCFRAEIAGVKILIAGDTIYGGYHPRIGSDVDVWRASLARLLEVDFDALAIGHSTPTMMFDAKTRVREASERFGTFFDPWFKPFHANFRY